MCDHDDIAKSCKMFNPLVSIEQAREEFLEKLSDDEYVFNNYRDMATLQWVIGQRVHEVPLTAWERFVFWLKAKLFKPEPRIEALPAAEIPSDIWDQSSKVSNAPPQTPGS